jgi:hypothetical protein
MIHVHRPASRLLATCVALLAPGAVVLTAAPAQASGHRTAYTDADVAPVIATDSPAQARMTKHNAASKTRVATSTATRPSTLNAPKPGQVSPDLNNNKTLSSSSSITRTPPGGSAGTLQSKGYSYVQVPFFETSATYTNNAAHTYWLGSSPFNASSIKLSETWSNSGVSISLSFPLGAGFSGTGGSTTDTTSVSHNWQVNSYVDTVKFSAFDIYRVRHTVAGKFQFGTTAFTVTTTDSSLV